MPKPAAAPPSDGGECQRATFPSPPAVKDAGGVLEIVTAVRSVDVGDTGTTVGYDLDGKCTCEGDGPSCLAPDWAEQEMCDGPGGRDARSAKAFATFVQILGSGGSKDFNATAADGQWSLLVRVRGYDGQPDDDRVEVAVFPSDGLGDDAGAPKWDSSDAWPVPATAIADGGVDYESPRFVDHNGYVTGGVLVASLPESDLLFSGSKTVVPLHLTAGFLTGKLEHTASGWRLRDGTVAARWKMTDIFRTLAAMRIAGTALCVGNPYYSGAKKIFCDLPDITSTLASPTAECDAVSLGFSFQGEPASLGPIEPVEPWTSPCDPGKDPTNDTCP